MTLPECSIHQQEMLDLLQKESFQYFLYEVNPANGLIGDKTKPDWPSSIAAVGLALAAYPVAVERGFISRSEAAAKTLATLRFFRHSAQGPEPGYGPLIRGDADRGSLFRSGARGRK